MYVSLMLARTTGIIEIDMFCIRQSKVKKRTGMRVKSIAASLKAYDKYHIALSNGW